MYETDSVASSYADGDDIEHFLNRCSICFDAQLDMCLEHCKDQYCIDCFQRYITEVVKSSWGLSVTPIRCPVCNELIPKHEWSRYVSQNIVAIYDKFNKPYRSYIRACPHCETDIIPCPSPSSYGNSGSSSGSGSSSYSSSSSSLSQQPQPATSRALCEMMENMLQSCPKGESHKNHIEHIAVKRWIPIMKRQDWSDTTKLPSLYKRVMNDITTFQENHKPTNETFAYKISNLYMNLCCVKPEIWKQIQFLQIGYFPNMKCPECKVSICLHCGYDNHGDLDCEENMKKMSKTCLDKEMRKTVKWKLENSHQCPNCSIMINRDEGCNKVDCSYCGFCFCWACRSSWSEGCGFYRCSNMTANNNNNVGSNSTIITEEKTELGVPNIKNIQARFNNNNAATAHPLLLSTATQQQQHNTQRIQMDLD